MAPIRDFEELQAFAAAARRRRWANGAKTLLFAVAVGVGICAHVAARAELPLPVGAVEAWVSTLIWLAIILSYPFLRWRAYWTGRPGCPACGQRMNRQRLERAVVERACPGCAHVFPSRLPPEAQRVALDAEHLPRVLLAHEVDVPAGQGDEPAPLDPTNPYAASADVTPAPVMPRSPHALWALLMLVWLVTAWPVLTLFKSRARLIAQLPTPPKPDDEQWRVFADSFVRSQRRAAAFILPWTVLLPPVLFFLNPLPYALELWRTGEPAEALWHGARGAVVCFLGGVMALFFAWTAASVLFRRHFRHWMQGSPVPARAEIDEKTGYYGLRLRFTDVTTQQQLPRVRFRYRQQATSDLIVRVVNVAAARALEKNVACPEAGAWQVVDVDLRALVRQSDPEFFGDELHLTGDPDGGLEVDEFEIVPR